jgi:hypothetical protein
MALDRDGLLAMKDSPAMTRRRVALPGGDSTFVRMLTVAEAYDLDALYREKGRDDFRTRLVIASACDQDGNRHFTQDDFEAARGLPFAVSDALFDAAMALNNLTEEAKKELGKD